MQIIIDISEDDYKEVLKDAYSGTPFENKVFSTIQNGIPLNKTEIYEKGFRDGYIRAMQITKLVKSLQYKYLKKYKIDT